MDLAALHHRARTSGVNPVLYFAVRLVLVPFFRLYFRLERHGREHIPADGPLLIAANHRSFLDPFVIGALVRRPVYYVAKKELFRNPLHGWFLNALGAFPVDRGRSDKEMLETARQILARGDAVVIFPEGTRIRPGGLGTPRRGVGRLALESGTPVMPVAVVGTDDVRKGWRIRPRRVRLRAGRPLTFPQVDRPSPQLAQAVTDRIWPCVALQWEWLGGLPPLRRATVVGAGARAATIATVLRRAGLDVEHGAPGEVDPAGSDVVVLAVPADGLAPATSVVAERIPATAGVVVLDEGLVPPLGELAGAFVAEHVAARAVASLSGPGLGDGHGSVVVASRDADFGAQVAAVLAAAGMDAQRADEPEGGRRLLALVPSPGRTRAAA